MALGALIAGAVGTIVAAAVSVTKALAVAGLAIQGLLLNLWKRLLL